MAEPTNIALLTQSHSAIAAKKRARSGRVEEIIFDEEARREFLTGFHKRKVARTEAAKKKAIEREKEERRETRNEQRRALRERAKENASQIESVYGGTLDEDEWVGIHSSEDGHHENGHKYEGEEQLATVIVVEDFDLDPFDPNDAKKPTSESDQSHTPVLKPAPKRKERTESKNVRYQTKQARKHERLKQRAKWAEKVETGRRRNRDKINKKH